MPALVVEDQKQMRSINRRMIYQMKYFGEVDEAEDGDVAWLYICKGGAKVYDLVVCTVNMPVLDGINLLRRCHEHQTFRFIPFIMLSGSSEGANVVAAVGEWGARDFIVKPVSSKFLQERIEALMKQITSPEECLYREAEALKEDGSLADALKLCDHVERMLESGYPRARWLNLKGECLMLTGNVEEAASHFETAIIFSPIYVKAYKNYAIAQQRLGNIEQAVSTLKRAEGMSPTNDERTLLLGQLLLENSQVDEARRFLESLAKRKSGHEREVTLKKVAKVFIEAGLFKEAEDTYMMALDINFADIETFNQLGIALRKQGKIKEAESCYYNVIRRHPRYPDAHYNMGIFYMFIDNQSKAIHYFKKALDLDPNFEAAQRMLVTAEQNRQRRG